MLAVFLFSSFLQYIYSCLLTFWANRAKVHCTWPRFEVTNHHSNWLHRIWRGCLLSPVLIRPGKSRRPRFAPCLIAHAAMDWPTNIVLSMRILHKLQPQTKASSNCDATKMDDLHKFASYLWLIFDSRSYDKAKTMAFKAIMLLLIRLLFLSFDYCTVRKLGDWTDLGIHMSTSFSFFAVPVSRGGNKCAISSCPGESTLTIVSLYIANIVGGWSFGNGRGYSRGRTLSIQPQKKLS